MLDAKGNMYVDEDDIVELMLQNRRVKILPSNRSVFNKFENECKTYNITVPFQMDTEATGIEWNMPIDYVNLDIREYISRNAELNNKQWARVDLELREFESRGLMDLLRFLVYMVHVIRANNIVYGVGRGSSISSYVLFLLGVHRIDSLKYNLDIKEFLK